VKAFVLEDNPIDLKLWRLLLLDTGHEAIAWTRVQGALAEIHRQRPDVVLLDLNLAGEDGLDLVRTMRTMPGMRDIPVLAVTAYPQRYTTADVLAAGCTGIMLKPVDTRRLVLEMQSLCQRPGAGRSDEHLDHR